MPHLIDDAASGSSASINARSWSRIWRRGPVRLVKKESMGAPRSARGPGPGRAALAGLAADVLVGVFFAATLAPGFARPDLLAAAPAAVAGRRVAVVFTPP